MIIKQAIINIRNNKNAFFIIIYLLRSMNSIFVNLCNFYTFIVMHKVTFVN